MYLYVIQASEFCHKIGISHCPKERLMSLRTGHYQDLRLLFKASMPNPKWALWGERLIHEYLSDKNIRGEWFAVSFEEAKAMVLIASEDAEMAASEGWRNPAHMPVGSIVFADS